LAVAVATSVFAFAGALYFTFRDVPRLMVVYFSVLDLGMLAVWRLLVAVGVRILQQRGRAFSRVLVAGGGEGLERLALAFHNGNAIPGVRLVGVATDEKVETLEEEGVLRLGRPEDVPNLLRMIKVDEVILAFPAAEYERAERLAYGLLPLPLRVRMAPDFLRMVVARSSVESLGGIPLIGLREPAVQGLNWAIKRVFDLGASLALLVLLSPLMLLIGVLIRLDSPGPALFRQKRVGENGRIFTIFKFRTMAADSEALPEVEPNEEGRQVFKVPDDPRVTRVGKFLRKASLDELPNLINVIKGEMSLVGPRPELLPIADSYEPWQRSRLAVLPGMTGWWQVSGRSDLPLHLNTEYDVYYVRNYSLWLDIKILFKTVGAVLQGKGAY
jgi:exopolysaccharide biosynthesis polyprenyl glycosylphosphotransferase